MTETRWFAGVDWGSKEHAVCLIDGEGKVLGERKFGHTGTELGALCDWLVEKSGAAPEAISVAIEVPRGAVVETLLERGMAVYAINPKQSDRFRDRFTVPGAKDDRRDARVLADSVRTDMHCFRKLRVDGPAVIELREWTRIAANLQEDRVRLNNRLHQQLSRYFPQLLDLTDDSAAESFLALWELVPKPANAKRLRVETLAKHFKHHRISRITAEEGLKKLREKPLTVAPGTTEAAVGHIRILIAQLRVVNFELKRARTQLEELVERLGEETQPEVPKAQRDADILRSLPGVGPVVVATLLAEAQQALAARDYHALRSLAGVAPITRQSGKRCVVSMRYACQMRLRDALYHWSRVAMQRDPKVRAGYAELRARGHSHGRCLRTLGDRLLKVACAMLRDGTHYGENRLKAA